MSFIRSKEIHLGSTRPPSLEKTCRRLDRRVSESRKSKQGSVLSSEQFGRHPGPWSLSFDHLSFTHLVLIPFSLQKSQNLSNFQANNITPRQATNSPLNSLSFCCGSSLWGPQESKALPCHASLCNLSIVARNRGVYTEYRATLKMMEATWSNWELHIKCSLCLN